MSHSDQNYIVFCRIEGIKDENTSTDLVAASVEVLARVVSATLRSTSSAVGPLNQYPSVYGRLVVVPGEVETALELAKSILRDSAKDGVRLAVGIAVGKVDGTQDLRDQNIVGVDVNRAARLAHLDDGEGRIAVEALVAKYAIDASQSYQGDVRN